MDHVLNKENIMKERFVAFLDILGFTEIVKRIESNNNVENADLIRIKVSVVRTTHVLSV
jgi:hypothetical protein